MRHGSTPDLRVTAEVGPDQTIISLVILDPTPATLATSDSAATSSSPRVASDLTATAMGRRFIDLLCREAAEQLMQDPELLVRAKAHHVAQPGRTWGRSWTNLLRMDAGIIAGVMRSSTDATRSLRAASPLLRVLALQPTAMAGVYARSSGR